MASQQPFHVTTQLHEADLRGGLSLHSPHCIAYKLPKQTVTAFLDSIAKKYPDVQTSVFTVSVDWIQSLANSIAQELSKNFNLPPEKFIKDGTAIANVVSSIGNGIWSSGITPINAIKDIETNIPLYISDYFDQLAGYSREHVFDEDDEKPRIGSDISGLKGSSKSYSAEKPGPETAISGKYVNISWNLPAANAHYSFNTDSNTPSFASSGKSSNAEVYRYFAFIDPYKQAIALNENGTVYQTTYDFTDSSQLWRIDDFGSFYGLYNKKYGKYLGRNPTSSKPNNNWHESAVYLVENSDTSTYSIKTTQNNREFQEIAKDLTLVTVPLVAWRNSSGQFLSLDDANNGTLSFSSGEKHENIIIPKSDQLFLFVPHPDFSQKSIVIGNNGKSLEFNPLNKTPAFSYKLNPPSKLPFVLFEYDQNIWPRSANFLASRLQQPLILAAAEAAAVLPPGKGTRVRVWKADPSVTSIGIRELFLVRTDIEAGPKDSFLDTNTDSNVGPIEPDENGDFLLNFEDTPSNVPESENHIRFDAVHTYSAVRYTYDLLSGDLEFLDGKPPELTRPWGNKPLTIHPHAGEDANAFYSREGVLKFFYMRQGGKITYLCRSFDIVAHEAGHSFLDVLQPGWLSSGQTGGFHESFGDLCSLFTLISMAEIADLFVTLTKANLRDPSNFLSAVGEEFGDALFKNKGKGLRNLSNNLKGSQVGSEVHDLSQVFSGFYYDVLVDVFALERNPIIKSDTETLMDVGTILRRALMIAIRVSSARPVRTKYQEIATNLETALATLGRRLGVDLSGWAQIVRTHAKTRELPIAGMRR